ncbi:hypothetical protein BCR44DRAFT_1430299, partial [Catenaria anguillulae PL171]
MKTTSFLVLALVALGMSAQASPAPAKAAAASGSANTERVDYRCYYNCIREGRDDCDWLCNIPGPDIPMAAAPAKARARFTSAITGATFGASGAATATMRAWTNVLWTALGPTIRS